MMIAMIAPYVIAYIAVVVTLVLIVAVFDLVIDLRSARPRRNRELKAALIDEGIALAARVGGPGDVKLRNAVDWAEQRCVDHRIKTTRNELARLVEIRLHSKK